MTQELPGGQGAWFDDWNTQGVCTDGDIRFTPWSGGCIYHYWYYTNGTLDGQGKLCPCT